jgi:hypothetical protein
MEVKTRRAWNGGIKNIDELMAWMYDKDILNKTEKARKDSIFRQYYRYYNDGDTPRGVLRKYGISSWSSDLEMYLEMYLEEFIKAMLKKYCGKIDRKAFYTDRKLSQLHTIKNVADREDSHSLIYFCEKYNEDFDGKLGALKDAYDAIRAKITAVRTDLESYGVSYILEEHPAMYDIVRDEYNQLMIAINDIKFAVKRKIESTR